MAAGGEIVCIDVGVTVLKALQVAAGNPLPLCQSSIPLVGHAFEARIYAENPRNNFLPDSGQLLYLSTPAPTTEFAIPYTTDQLSSDNLIGNTSLLIAPSLRIEQGFTQGAQIGVFYDPMIAKVVVHGRDRTEALRILRKALDEYHVVGVSTNVEFLRTLAGNKAFINEEVETGFIPVCLLQFLSLLVLIQHLRNILTNFSRPSWHLHQKYWHRLVSLLHCVITIHRQLGSNRHGHP